MRHSDRQKWRRKERQHLSSFEFNCPSEQPCQNDEGGREMMMILIIIDVEFMFSQVSQLEYITIFDIICIEGGIMWEDYLIVRQLIIICVVWWYL